MDEYIELRSIEDDLLILNKMTIDTLFKLDNCSDCIALYIFYYKTAKWQKTNTIKANDAYIKKSLKWGTSKIQKTKQTLKENGLIDIVQRRKDGKISGWFVRLSYIVTQKKTDNINVKVEDVNNTQIQQVENSTSSNQETNALKEKIKCLNEKIEMLEKNNKELKEENETLKSNSGKRKKKKVQSYDEQIESYSENEDLRQALKAFIQMRKMIKKPLTDYALSLILKKLDKLSNDDITKTAIVNQSVLHSWQGVFPLKDTKENNKADEQKYCMRESKPTDMKPVDYTDYLHDGVFDKDGYDKACAEYKAWADSTRG